MASAIWNSARCIFRITYYNSRPYRKLALIEREGLIVFPRRERLQLRYLHSRIEHLPRVKFPQHSQLLQMRNSPVLNPHGLQHHPVLTLPQLSKFRTLQTSSRKLMPPLLWALLKPISKGWAMIFGRYTRRWWAALPPDTRTQYKKLFGGMKGILFGLASIIAVASVINYFLHLKENPYTGRSRFISLTSDQVEEIAKYEEESCMDQYKGLFLHKSHPLYDTIARCTTRLLKANEDDIPGKKWQLSVIDDKTKNAFVLPNGHIFVFTGMLKDLHNIDQLAVILGHEIAHCCMDHAVELISRTQIFDFVMIAMLAAIWTLVPGDGIAIITQWFYQKLMKLMMELPYSRELELEADEVGLMFAAKACYDIREAPALWAYEEALQKYTPDAIDIPEFLSTHPAHASRTAKLQALLPKALECRSSSTCPMLSKADPFLRVQKAIDEMKSTAVAEIKKPAVNGK